LWPPHKHRTNLLPVHAVHQREELGMVELNPMMPDAGPAELRFLEALGIKAKAGSIPPNNLYSVSSFGTEHVE
jgi:hypothetical protein